MELNRFRKIAERLYPPFKPGDGVSLEEVERAEIKNRFTLPKVLRDFYLLAGNHEPINYSFNCLVGIAELKIEAGKLVFYTENQGVCDWAIDKKDLGQDDPPIWQGQQIQLRSELDWYSEQDAPLVWEPQWIQFNDDKIEWYPEASRLSVFLTNMLCRQSVMGGLPYCAVLKQVENSTVRRIEDNFELVDFGEDYKEFCAFSDQGKILCLSLDENKPTLHIASSDKNNFLEISRLLSVRWNYHSPDDE